MLIVIIIIFAIIVLFEAPGLIKKKYWRELLAFSILLLIGFILYILRSLGVQFPSVTGVLIDIFK